jgi:hypothetical protein
MLRLNQSFLSKPQPLYRLYAHNIMPSNALVLASKVGRKILKALQPDNSGKSKVKMVP